MVAASLQTTLSFDLAYLHKFDKLTVINCVIVSKLEVVSKITIVKKVKFHSAKWHLPVVESDGRGGAQLGLAVPTD